MFDKGTRLIFVGHSCDNIRWLLCLLLNWQSLKWVMTQAELGEHGEDVRLNSLCHDFQWAWKTEKHKAPVWNRNNLGVLLSRRIQRRVGVKRLSQLGWFTMMKNAELILTWSSRWSDSLCAEMRMTGSVQTRMSRSVCGPEHQPARLLVAHCKNNTTRSALSCGRMFPRRSPDTGIVPMQEQKLLGGGRFRWGMGEPIRLGQLGCQLNIAFQNTALWTLPDSFRWPTRKCDWRKLRL